MTMPEVIDVHVHLTRDPAQEQLVFPKPGYPEEWYRANEPRVIPWMDAEGFSHLFMINYMDTNRMIAARLARMAGASEAALEGARVQLQEEHVERVRRFNAWACELGAREPRIIPFPCVDIGIFYDVTVMMEELEARLAGGARGIKLHPGLGHYFPADERMFPLYERLQEADVPILSDTGSLSPAPEGGVYGEPLNFVPVFEQFPRLRFIMAHAASAFWDERVLIAQRFPNVYFDLAGGFYSPTQHARDDHRACPMEDAPRFLRALGIERVLWASDAPGHEAGPQLRSFMQIPLSDEERERILARNAREFIGLDSP